MALFDHLFHALFTKSGTTHELDLGMDMDQFKRLDKKFFDEGFRLTFANLDQERDTVQAAWEPGHGAQFWLHTHDFEELKAADHTHRANGLGLTYLTNGSDILAIWKTGPVHQHWVMNVTFDEFKAKDEELKKQGMMLTRLCDTLGKYAAIWDKGQLQYRWISTTHEDQFVAFKEDNHHHGRHCISFGGGNRVAVFREDGHDDLFVLNKQEPEFTARAKQLFKEGFRIADLYVLTHPTG